MTTPVQPVTVRFFDQDGSPMSVRVSFKLTVQETYNGLIVAAGPDYVTTDALTGLGVINLFPNALGANGSQYTVKAVDLATGKKVLESLCTIPNAPCYLDLVLNQEPFPTIDAAGVALAAAQGALALVTAQADIATAKAVMTAADVVLTHADVVLTHADAAQTALDRVATGADRVQTGLDRASATSSATTASTAASTATSNAAQSAADAAATAANRAQTGIDKAAAAASAVTAAGQATIATTKAGEAAASALSATNAAATATSQAGVATAKADLATAQQGLATIKAAEAAASAALADSAGNATIAQTGATTATTQASTATAARIAAEAARDAALIQAGVYTTEALGRAAVADGVAFKVQGSGDVAAYEYRRTNSTTSVLIATYPSASLVSLGIKSFKPSPNRFNYRTVILGKLNQANNYYGDNASYASSVRIPVLPGEVYYFTAGDPPVANTSEVYSFAVSPTMADNPITIVAPVAGAITIPAGNYFLSFSAVVSRMTDATKKWQLTKSAAPTRFYDAGFIIDPSYSDQYPLVVSYEAMKSELDALTSLPKLAGIKESQTSFLRLGKNSYQHVDWQWGYSVNTSNGLLNASGTGWVATNYIPITPSVANFITIGFLREEGAPYLPFSAYYDENKIFINTAVTIATDATTGITTITPPANARYLRTSSSTPATEAAAAAAFKSLMVSVGYAPFELYGYYSNGTSSIFRDEAVRTYLKPFAGKSAAFLGDSITMQGRYFGELFKATGIEYRTSIKNLGQNGAILRTVADALTPEMLTNVDVVTVLAGTNDYGHGNYTLGSITDTKDSLTFHGSIYYVIDKILTAKSTVRIVFFTPLQRGTWGVEPYPYATGYPNGDAPGANGLTMPSISKAIVDVCRMRGIACLDLFSVSGCNDKTFLNYYPSNDLLHPHDAAAARLGAMMGKFINQQLAV